MIRFDTKKDMEHYNSLYTQIYKKDKEIDRLNNIINELESYLERQQIEQGEYCDFFIKDKQIEVQEVLDKLKELKEDNK